MRGHRYHGLSGAFMRDHLATLLDDFRRFDREVAVVATRATEEK